MCSRRRMLNVVLLPILFLVASGATSLTNSKVTVATVNAPPYIVESVAGVKGGMLHEIWEAIVARALAKGQVIDYQFRHDPHSGSYVDTVADLVDPSVATDIVLADLFLSEARVTSGVHFPLPFGSYAWSLVKSRRLSNTHMYSLEEVNSAGGKWKVCVDKWAHERMVKIYPEIKWIVESRVADIMFSEVKAALQHLIDQECEMALLHREGAQFMLADNGRDDPAAAKFSYKDFMLLPGHIGKRPIQIAASTSAMSTELSVHLAGMYDDGTFDRLTAKYSTNATGMTEGIYLLAGYHFDIVAVPDPPYVIYSTADGKTGNSRFQGKKRKSCRGSWMTSTV